MESVLMPTEIDLYIETMVPQSMSSLGTKSWLDWHQRLQKLNQEALVEASAMKHEAVKEALIACGKVPTLIHEAILINIWKNKVLPLLLKSHKEPPNTFMAYSVLYHEAVCVALLELVLYHPNCCETMQDSAADLLDYACGLASLLLSVRQREAPKNEQPTDELIRQRENLSFDIGIRSLTIIRYLAECLDSLPVSIFSKMYGTYDIPVLFAQILMTRPWNEGSKQYVGGKWIEWDGDSIGQYEAQIWLTLRQLLLDPAAPQYYSITDCRRNQLMKIIPLLSVTILDQISPLIELKQWLYKLSLVEQPAAPTKPLILEAMLEIKEAIINQCGGKWKKIAKAQYPIIFCNDKKVLMETAQTLSEAYNTEFLEKFDVKATNVCEQCGKKAIQRCSKCKKAWYCSRTCQVTHWSQHRDYCSN